MAKKLQYQQVKPNTIIFTNEFARQLQMLKSREIKCDEDTPEIVNWEKAEVGRFYRTIKG